jgi:chaperonin GroEL
MIPKNLDFGEEGRGKLQAGISKLAKAVKSTLGPRGGFAILESENHIGGLTITKDGVTVAKTINLPDAVEDVAVRIFRQAAENTAISSGDGTTTSIVLAEAIMQEADNIEKIDNRIEVLRYIQLYSEHIVNILTKRSKKLTGKRLYDVATVSANNDKNLGRLIGDAYKSVGNNGIVTIENSKDKSTYLEKIDGIKIDRGFTTNHHMSDRRARQSVMKDCYVLLSDQEISSVRDIEMILKHVIDSKKPLLIISEMSIAALSTLTVNIKKGNIKACAIIPPSHGRRRKEMLKDLSKAFNAQVVSDETGNDWGMVDASYLGRVDKAIVDEKRTVIMSNEVNKEAKALIDDLQGRLSQETIDSEKEELRERIACLSGTSAIVHIGGNSDVEQKEKKDRADDAVGATRAAMEEGVLPGGGIALYDAAKEQHEFENDDQMRAWNILSSAMKQPFYQIIRNAGMDADKVEGEISKGESMYGYGLDLKANKYGDMVKMGIIDPAKVTKDALRNAVSVSTTILGGEVIVTNMRAE